MQNNNVNVIDIILTFKIFLTKNLKVYTCI
jgi:hypothetical protein